MPCTVPHTWDEFGQSSLAISVFGTATFCLSRDPATFGHLLPFSHGFDPLPGLLEHINNQLWLCWGVPGCEDLSACLLPLMLASSPAGSSQPLRPVYPQDAAPLPTSAGPLLTVEKYQVQESGCAAGPLPLAAHCCHLILPPPSSWGLHPSTSLTAFSSGMHHGLPGSKGQILPKTGSNWGHQLPVPP